jgi:hypothetical protein
VVGKCEIFQSDADVIPTEDMEPSTAILSAIHEEDEHIVEAEKDQSIDEPQNHVVEYF